MTTAAELDRYRMPLPGPDTPVIPDDRVVALHAHLNAHYSASKWPLCRRTSERAPPRTEERAPF
ncbi:hypothetical protein ABZS98_32320, partial [Streptomyces avermitilis]|uniref:hypothetical protein n=1 Tax=Streptomyces avermitilis TaxID=33903 RepID=UPI0033BBA9C2